MKLFQEIRKHLLNLSSFPLSIYPLPPSAEKKQEPLHLQLEKALRERPNRLLFLIGPYGSGKTTLLTTFFEKRPSLRYTYRSFIKISNPDFAFLHLTDYFSRLLFFSLVGALGALLYSSAPHLFSFPFLFVMGALSIKSLGNLIYLFHETFRSLLFPKPKIVVIEDLEKSVLSQPIQWSFLANLWQQGRSYIITLGHSPGNPEEVLRLLDLSIKLGGSVIELSLDEEANHALLAHLDPDLPFAKPNQEKDEQKGWMALFTYREIYLLFEETSLTLHRRGPSSKEEKQLKYIGVALSLLLEKLKIANREVFFLEKKREIAGIGQKNFSQEQAHYLTSFFRSIDPQLKIIVSEKFPS